MKNKYEMPKVEIIKYETYDIITTSMGSEEDGELPFVPIDNY